MSERRTDGWQQEIEELTGLYRDRFGELGTEELNWKPAPDVWSVGQVLDHVIRTNESFYPVVERIRRDGYRPPLLGRLPLVPRLMGSLVLRAVQPDADMKVKTRPVWEPTRSAVPSDIVDRFVRHQSELAGFVGESADLVDRGVVVTSPASRFLVYGLGTAFDILVAHERRHLNQAEEILDRQLEA